MHILSRLPAPTSLFYIRYVPIDRVCLGYRNIYVVDCRHLGIVSFHPGARKENRDLLEVGPLASSMI